MADCSRPPHRNQRGLAKNLSSVFGFGNKGAYDDVFVSRPKMRAPAFTPGVKDYAEIFNCSQPSSIPVLELDEFEKSEGFGDKVRSSEVDYGNVFGSLGEGQIGSSYEEVFCVGGDGDGVRRTEDSHALSRGSDRSTAVEESQKLTHESLRGKKHSMSSEKITRGGKDEIYETNGQAKYSEAPVSARGFDGTVSQKKAGVTISGAVSNNFKQYIEETPVGKHSRNVSSGGLSKHDADGFIEIDVRCGNGYASDKSISNDMQMDRKIIKPKAKISEVATSSDSIPQLGSPVATPKEQAGLKSGVYNRSNASEVGHGGSNNSSREGIKVQSVYGPVKPFVRDSAVDENLARHNCLTSKTISSSGLTHDQVGALATPEILTGNSNARNSNASDNAKDDNSSYSQQEVKFQTVTCLRKPFISNSPVDATDVRPRESSKLTPATHSQHIFCKVNTAYEGDLVPKIIASGNADSESSNMGSNGHLTNSAKFKNEVGLKESISSRMVVDTKAVNFESQNFEAIPPSGVHSNLGHVGSSLKKALTAKSGESRSTDSSVKDNHSPSSSDDEIDKNSDAAISAAAVKKAIREAQAWINIAKESNGVKGFMTYVAKKSGNVKVVKEAHSSEVKENPKFFDLGQTATENNFSTGAARKDCIASRSFSSEMKIAPADILGEEVNSKGAEFCASDRLHQMKDVEIQSSLRGKTEVASTIQHAKPSINISEEKLAVCSSKADEKLVHRKEDIAMQSMVLDSGQVNLGPEANCFEVPTVEKTEAEVNSASHEAFLNSYHESNTVTKITKAEKEPQEDMNNSDQGFMMRGFHGDFGQCKIECSANSFEVKEDVVPGTGDIAVRSNQNEAIKCESESLSIPSSDNSEEDLTFLEKEYVKESELDPHDQVSDCEDLDSQDYASAEENWVSTDTDDETNDKDLNLSVKNKLYEIEDMENMVAPEVTIITEEEDVSPPIVDETEESEDLSFQSISAHEANVTSEERTVPHFKYSNEDPIAEETDESEDMPLQKMVTHEGNVTPEERTSSVFNFSNEDSIVEETDESEDLPLQTMVIHEEKFTSEGSTAPNFNYSKEDPIVEETDERENAPVQHIVAPGSMITSEDGLAPCFNSTNGDPRVETEGIQTAENVVIPESLITFEEDIAPCFDKSNEDQMVGEITGDITDEPRVRSRNYEHEKGAAGVAESFMHEQTSLDIEDLESVSRVEAESASRVDHESSHSEGSEVEIVSTDDFTEESKADTIEESRSTPWTCEQEKQELGAANDCNLESRTEDREELQNVARVEAEALEERHDTMKAKGFENDQVTMDAAGQEDAVKLGSTPLYSENGNHELEAAIQFCESIPNSSKNDETIEFELHSENLIHPAERHKRKKWEIPRETFELTELEIEASEVEDSIEQDSFELESQMDKHERKKWEIPNETFELPVMGDEVKEENEGNVEQDMERVTQPAEKPERKKWKIQKEVFEVPILCAEAVQEISKQEGFVIRTASEEEIGIGDHLSNNCVLPEEIVQHDKAHEGVAVPYKGVSSELCGDNSKEDMAKEWVPEVKMVDEEEPQKQLNKDFNQQETKVEEEKAVGQDECTKGPEDINVKDEIKRTLGMLWKKIYTGKQDEDSETVESVAKEEDTFEDINGLGVEKDLNLEGPVELVESPRLKDDIEILNFSGQRSRNEENMEEASYSEPFEVNGSSTYNSREFVSTTEIIEEVQTYSPSAFDSYKHEEDEKGSQDEETCKQNYNANDVESLSGEILSSSEDSTEMAPVHGACELKKERTPERNISDVNECIRIDSETVCRLEHLLPDDSMLEDAENTQKVKKVLQPNVSKNAHDDIADDNISEDEVETHLVDDLFDKSCTDSEQQETSSSRQDSKSVSDSEVRDVPSSHEFEQNEDKNETGLDTVEQACRWKWIFGEESMDNSNEQGETSDVDLIHKEKPKTKEMADEINMSHVTGKAKISGDEPPRMEERAPEGMHKEVIPDQEVLKNMMRAKEIERMAVERAIREARERAFAEARERAATEKANADARERAATERANAEFRERVFTERANADARDRAARERAIADARRKVTANGQERSQKTSSEAKLAAEKNALEAKRKAELERAAVERATMEARQRAMEKAMFRKDQVSQSSSSRSNSASDDQYGSSSKDNDDKTSESALRFKARNERHQRIAERAANALAEKNTRDLLVQREQAERNRLSEVLDAEVKRWARGKTGNLRALLSTLQYILGPDSGWQPIHLTEIVTADAVKKAYRKATLFVHPDKLQQRGAAIKQKYVCEKVFDLLKEAWNRFDRDER